MSCVHGWARWYICWFYVQASNTYTFRSTVTAKSWACMCSWRHTAHWTVTIENSHSYDFFIRGTIDISTENSITSDFSLELNYIPDFEALKFLQLHRRSTRTIKTLPQIKNSEIVFVCLFAFFPAPYSILRKHGKNASWLDFKTSDRSWVRGNFMDFWHSK